MADPQQVLGARVRDALVAAYGADYADADPLIRPSSFADAQSNVALPLAKRLGQAPRDIAAEIVGHLDIDDVCEPPDGQRPRLHQPHAAPAVDRRRRHRPAGRPPARRHAG